MEGAVAPRTNVNEKINLHATKYLPTPILCYRVSEHWEVSDFQINTYTKGRCRIKSGRRKHLHYLTLNCLFSATGVHEVKQKAKYG